MSIKRFISKKPTAVFVFRYEREDGLFREINVPVGFGRFRKADEAEAREIAERRLNEQYGDPPPRYDTEGVLLEPDPHTLVREDLHQRNYSLVSVDKR